MKFRPFLVSMILIVSFVVRPASAAQKPLDYFFKKPQFKEFQLSPDGKNLAVLERVDERVNLIIINLENRIPKVITNEKDQDIHKKHYQNGSAFLFTFL